MPERLTKKKRSAVFIDLDLLEYGRALEIQRQTLQSKMDKTLDEDLIFFVEHPPVFTLGKRGGLENLSVSQYFLRSKNIGIVQTDRGGNITYHGPGQAVLYPIVDLEKNRIGVKDFVFGLEEIMKRTACEFGIDAHRNKKNHGIWVGHSKIGSVGISVKKGISFHGLAMNINTDLEPFSWINPCGLSGITMTSVKQEKKSETNISMEQVKQLFQKYFLSVFDYSLLYRSGSDGSGPDNSGIKTHAQ